MKNREWNEKLHDWLCEEGYALYIEELERVREGLMVQLRTAATDHRYIQGKLDAIDAQINFKKDIRFALDNDLIDEETE